MWGLKRGTSIGTPLFNSHVHQLVRKKSHRLTNPAPRPQSIFPYQANGSRACYGTITFHLKQKMPLILEYVDLGKAWCYLRALSM